MATTTATNLSPRAALIARHVAHFRALIEGTAVSLPDAGYLAGPWTLNGVAAAARLGEPPRQGEDNLHFAFNVACLLRLGLPGIAREARASAERLKGAEDQADAVAYLDAIADCYEAATAWVAGHRDEAARRAAAAAGPEAARWQGFADTCGALAAGPPQTFVQALQLFWFAYVIRGHGTIGRLDQHLYPFYRDDLATGRLTRDEAFARLRELWEILNRCWHGDTLRNLMLGGQDAEGRDASNDLSLLMLEVSLAVRQPEPHVNVRLHAHTAPEFLDRALDVQLLGHGQAVVYYDELMIPALEAVGVPLAAARNYSNDGCTEVTIDGDSGISFFQMEALKCLELTLFNGDENTLPGVPRGQYNSRHTPPRPLGTSLERGFRSGDFTAMRSFAEVYEAFLRQYFHQLDRQLASFCQQIRRQQTAGLSAPFLAGTFPGVLATGRDPLAGGVGVPCFVVFSGSFPTVADALAALKRVVFEDQACTPAELLAALRADWVGREALRQRCLAAPKFGNDNDFVDELAADLVQRFCDHVRQYPTPTGKPFWPALYNFLFNDHAKLVGATPDGRRWGEPIAEHYSPTPGRARRGPTAVLRTVTKAPLAAACGSSIFHLSLPRSTFPQTADGKARLRQLVQAALDLGATVFGVAIYDADVLRAAQRDPEHHQDVVVRVWGFCAKFVDLPDDMQNHIIARIITETPPS